MNVVSPACYDQLSWLPAWIFVNKASSSSSSSSGSGALNDHDLELLLLKEVTKHNGSRPDYHHEDHIAHIKVGWVGAVQRTCMAGGGDMWGGWWMQDSLYRGLKWANLAEGLGVWAWILTMQRRG